MEWFALGIGTLGTIAWAHGSPFAGRVRYCERALVLPEAVHWRATVHVGLYRDWRFGYFSAYHDGFVFHAFWLGALCIQW